MYTIIGYDPALGVMVQPRTAILHAEVFENQAKSRRELVRSLGLSHMRVTFRQSEKILNFLGKSSTMFFDATF